MLLFAADAVAAEKPPWRARRRRGDHGLLRPGLHQLKDPKRWPAEPASPPAPLDEERFREVLAGMCEGVASPRMLRRIAGETFTAATEAGVDPFLLGALVYRQSRCVPTLETSFGVGLLQIQEGMLLGNVRGASLHYQVREDGRWQERTRPIPGGALRRLKNSLINLRLGAAVLAMWQEQHPAIDEVFPGSIPHRSAAAHFGWGDIVRGTGGEDRALTARRRLIERYFDDKKVEPRQTDLGFAVVPPLEGIPRVATSGLGDDREGGGRAHRGLDLDATGGEPVGSIADGVVTFAGLDMPAPAPRQPVAPDALATMKRPPLGPGGLFVCVRHVPHIVSCYMHLRSYTVTVGDDVKAGQLIGYVGRSGAKVSGPHLHLELRRDGAALDPVPILGSRWVIPPQDTLAHDFAVASKKLRLRKERRARRKAHRAAQAARLAEKTAK